MYTKAFALFLTVLFGASAVYAGPVTPRQKRDCKTDYERHCSSHSIESQGLRACMRKVRFQLSDRCVNALVADGEITPAMGQKLKSK
ncbi:hypothetical protein [Methyloligella solikamskensis]|uniref:Cysteine rich repeat-containing protein n=1 Tax=Methyloligella solikamskensis TaxID=1177756 RepID=A0ABW3J6U5_9HYPH